MLIKLSKVIIFTSSVVLIPFLSSCGDIGNEGENNIGKSAFVNAEIVENIPFETMKNIESRSNFGYKAVKIVYNTKDEKDKKVVASGLVVLPIPTAEYLKDNPTFSLSMVSDQHGTVFTNKEAPSVTEQKNGIPENKLGVMFSAIAGFITILPDYIGYGDSVSHYHPFILEKSSANATIDLIHATIKYCNDNNLPINGQLFLSGYSEGGYVTMAAAKEIEANHSDLSLKAIAPMAGPYALEDMAEGTLNAPMMSFPPFLAYISHAYSKTYDDVNISDMIQPIYSGSLENLFNRENNSTILYMSLPNIVTGNGQETNKLFTDDFITSFADKDNPVRKRFAENSVIDWKPKTKVRLYQCDNDEIIPYSMSELAENSFKTQGATSVELMPINTVTATFPDSVHSECALVAYPQVVAWFDKIRRGEIK